MQQRKSNSCYQVQQPNKLWPERILFKSTKEGSHEQLDFHFQCSALAVLFVMWNAHMHWLLSYASHLVHTLFPVCNLNNTWLKAITVCKNMKWLFLKTCWPCMKMGFDMMEILRIFRVCVHMHAVPLIWASRFRCPDLLTGCAAD